MKELILGGVRSGKSKLAEQHAIDSHLAVTCIVTASADDDEMARRIAAHRRRRPSDWGVVEAPYLLAEALSDTAAEGHCVVVDCLTLWLSNLLCAADEQQFRSQRERLLAALPQLPGTIIFVGNETSMGVIPLGELTRRFCDEAGLLHQQLAQHCDRVILTVAGLPHLLKGDR